jgi:hypothetical protein
MSNQRIDPAKVTKPIQLLAAWLIGLILIDGSFLGAAVSLTKPDWGPGALVLAAILNVPLFLVCLFLLQTKFRPEMQEDQYYASYLEKRYSVQTAQTELVEVSKKVSRPEQKLQSTYSGVRVIHRLDNAVATSTRVQINDLLPHYTELKNDLVRQGIEIANTFGSTSPGKGRPSPFLVTFGEGADATIFAKVVEIGLKYGLEGLSYSGEDYAYGDIYIGGYGYEFNPYLPIKSDAFKKLNLSYADEVREILGHSPELESVKKS